MSTLVVASPAHAAPQAHVAMVSVATGKVRTLRSAPNRDVFYSGPVWSADGRTVYVLREKYTVEGVDVLRVSASTGSAGQLDRYRGAEFAELSPAADRVAYSTDPDDDEGTTETVRIAPVGTGAGVGLTLPGGGEVSDLSFSPDGRLLAVGYRRFSDRQHFIGIYDAATLAEVRTVATNRPIFDDDSWLADSSALIYRAFGGNGGELARLDLATAATTTIATSPFEDLDGHAVAGNGVAALVARRTVSLHPDGGGFRVPRHNHFGGGIDFSPDSARLAYGYTRNGRALGTARVVVRDLATGAAERSVAAGDGEPISLAYSPTGRRIVVLVALRQVDY